VINIHVRWLTTQWSAKTSIIAPKNARKTQENTITTIGTKSERNTLPGPPSSN